MTTWIRKPADYDGNKSLEENRWRDRGAVKCPQCSHTVDLERGDTECENCDQMFNAVGQALAPPCQWAEDY
jgi:ssDNA-binding Zn-finger/Zn-ribbon topoisomerase 1